MDTAGSYTCIEYAAAEFLPDEIRDNADNPIVPVRTTINHVMDKVRLAQEIRMASLLFSTTTFSGYTVAIGSLTGGAQVAWDTYETSDPLQDVNQMHYNVRKAIGHKANALLVGIDVDLALRQHPVILDRIKYTQTGIVTDALLASLFDVEKYLVGSAMYTTTGEGLTASYTTVWGKSALLAFVPAAPALETPALGYTLTFKTPQANMYPEPRNHAVVYEALENVDEIVTCAAAGYYLTSVVA